MSTLSDNIVWYRGRLRMTQAQLAQRLSVHQSTVSTWESGEVEPTDANVAALEQEFRIGQGDLRKAVRPDPWRGALSEPVRTYGDATLAPPDEDAYTPAPLAELLRRRSARARLNDLRERLLDLDVSADLEDKIVGMASDADAIASALNRHDIEDLTESDLIVALDVISSTALRLLSEIRPRTVATGQTAPIEVLVLPDPAKDRKISEQEAARAARQAERDRSEREARSKEAGPQKRRRRK